MRKKAFRILSFLTGIWIGMATGIVAALRTRKKYEFVWKELSDKHLTLMLLLNQWMKIKQTGKSLEEYLNHKGISSIAIYGMGEIGERLYDELKNTGIEVRYAIDRNAKNMGAKINVVSMEEEWPKTDAIVVTAVFYYDEIESLVRKKTETLVLSLEDILYDLSSA